MEKDTAKDNAGYAQSLMDAFDDDAPDDRNDKFLRYAQTHALVSIAQSLVTLTEQMPVASDGVLRIEEMVP